MNLVLPVRAYFDSLVHASARTDALTKARHRSFIAPRLIVGFLALTLLPVYLVANGPITALEAAIFAWFLAPIAIAYLLSRTGAYERALLLSCIALAALITALAAFSGGLMSAATVWLVLVPLEAALSASRRLVLHAMAAALAGVGALAALTAFGATSQALSTSLVSPALGLVGIGSALLYAVLLALEAEAIARTGATLLSQEEDRYGLLAGNMSDVITRHGRGGIVQFASPAADRLIGVPAATLAGHGLFDRVHVADRPAYLAALDAAASGAGARSVEFRLRRGEQTNTRARPEFIWVEMRCRPLAPEGAIECHEATFDVVAVLRDVTERKGQEQAVAAARTEAEHANAAKSRFLATMSHELRTPLNAVIGFSEMLMQEETLHIDAARRQDYARLIHDSGHHLLSVVNLVLDMSKIETGNFVITPEPFDPCIVIRNCCDLMALKAREAGLDINLHVSPDLPEIVADKRALKQMLFNLLSNAIKFTDRGGQVSVEAVVAGDSMLLSVRDTGIGIGEADLRRVGDAFFQARGTYDRPHEGTGLGLSIVKGLVELHRGTLQVDSNVGVGTVITVKLPLDCERRQEADANVVALDAPVRREAATLLPQSSIRSGEVKKSA